MTAQQFRFQVRNPRGEVVQGVVAAENAAGAALALRNRGDHILTLVPAAARAAGSNSWASLATLTDSATWSSGPSKKDILDFTAQLAVMIRAGISIRTALEGIAEQVENPKFRKILLSIKVDVEGGRQFSDAIGRHPKLFSPLYVSMVRASEMSGSFARMLDRIANYLNQ